MVEAGWSPVEGELKSGQEAYLHYLAGVGILQDPLTGFAREIHKVELDVESDSRLVIVAAEHLIYSGARRVIQHANPPGLRTNKDMEQNFEGALPNIWLIVDSTFEKYATRFKLGGLAATTLHPAPFAEAAPYSHLARSRREKLYTLAMMGNLTPAHLFAEELDGRTLNGLKKQRKAA